MPPTSPSEGRSSSRNSDTQLHTEADLTTESTATDNPMQVTIASQSHLTDGGAHTLPIPREAPSLALSSEQGVPSPSLTATANSAAAANSSVSNGSLLRSEYAVAFGTGIPPAALSVMPMNPGQMSANTSPNPALPYTAASLFRPPLSLSMHGGPGQLDPNLNPFLHAQMPLQGVPQQQPGFDINQHMQAQQQILNSQIVYLQMPNAASYPVMSYNLGQPHRLVAQTQPASLPPQLPNHSAQDRGLSVELAPRIDDPQIDSAMTSSKPKAKPKKPLSAYNYFFAEERQRLLSLAEDSSDENSDEVARPQSGSRRGAGNRLSGGAAKKAKPSVGFEFMGKEVGKRWKLLDPEGRKKYEKLAQVDKHRYDLQMREYKKLQQKDLTQMRAQQEATVDSETMKRYLESGGDSGPAKKQGRKGSRKQGDSDA